MTICTIIHPNILHYDDFDDLRRHNNFDGEGVYALVTGEYRVADFNPLTSASSSFQRCNVSGAGVDDLQLLRVYYQNTRGLRTKLDDVYLAVTENDYDVYVLTETWLDNRFNSQQLFGDSFTVFRTDRNSNNSVFMRGGGVLIAVSSSYVCHQITECVPANLETTWVKILTETKSVFIGAVYIPPDKRFDCNVMQNVLDVSESVSSKMNTQDSLLVLGDFNQPGLLWKNTSNGLLYVDPLNSAFTPSSRILLDGIAFLGLQQINDIRNHGSRCLDLVFVNEECVSQCKIHEAPETMVPPDVFHPALNVEVTACRPVEFEDVPDLNQLDYRKTNIDQLRNLLSQIDWSILETFTDVNDAVNYYDQKLNDCLMIAVPLRKVSRKPPWSNAKLRRLKIIRAKALRKYTRQREPNTKRSFAVASNKYPHYKRHLYMRYILHTQQNLRRNPKHFWKFVNSKRKENGLPLTISLNDVCAVSPNICKTLC
ncbi:uncharacterized protein LOC129720409 [Wyeomyia smithii]|uniref:uncharacterized protein LOC129720409 n=1 Tax=Wyeomyia smithii TaxID=174621 RepID=UPI002467C002|nr:uncharacterized protein LOC129720409 [Wyeomyia smithii]